MKRSFLFALLVLTLPLCHAQTAVWTQTANPSNLQVNGVAFSNDGQSLISGTDCHPASIRKYDVTNGSILWDYTVGSSFMCIMGVGFSSNGNYISAVEEMGNILVFSNTTPTPALTSTIVMGTSYAFSIDFAPNNFKLAVGGSEGKLQTYVVSNSSLAINVNAHTSWVTAVQFSPNNSKIATGGSDNLVKLWDTTGTLIHTLNSHTEDITSLKLSPNNNFLISTSTDNSVKIWSVATGSLIQTISPSSYDVLGVDISVDNNHFAVISGDKFIRIYNLNTFNLEATFGLTTQGTPKCISWSKTNQSKIAVGYSNGTVTLYDTGGSVSAPLNTKTNNELSIYPNPSSEMWHIDFSDLGYISYEITNIDGKVFKSEIIEPGAKSIDISLDAKISKGVYYVKLLSKNNNSITKTIIKN